MIRLALYQPDIPQNTGAIMRLAACFGVGLDIIEPAGFVWDDKRMRRAGMDYSELAQVVRHASWMAFREARTCRRLVLLTTSGSIAHHRFDYDRNDVLLLGRESAGVPLDVHQSVASRVRIPMVAEARSLNVAMSAAIVLGEALRQTRSFPPDPKPDAV
jgi:tRNA (cytidine/uridine-2'-O-)-methyltransferase